MITHETADDDPSTAKPLPYFVVGREFLDLGLPGISDPILFLGINLCRIVTNDIHLLLPLYTHTRSS